MAMRILDLVFNLLILAAIVIAGVGHLLPWLRTQQFYPGPMPPSGPVVDERLIELQTNHAIPSIAALGVMALLTGISLAVRMGPGMRKFVLLLMFLAGLAAIGIQASMFSHYHFTQVHRELQGNYWMDDGFLVALIPTCFATGFCLVRMSWTMLASAPRPGLPADVELRPTL
jgi:hypothetical protein